MTACPACGRESPDDARFCASCGAALQHAASREERKVVSVVFVDLVGHTARSDSADPEDVRATLTPYYARVREELERFGGTVEKFIGDAVMAVFGAPVAHEDDAERAVRAALAVRDAMADGELDVRLAVNTGEALVAVDARAEAGEALVAGDVVNTAARLQSAAPVNGVLVGEATHRATVRRIDYREAPPVEAKGKGQPVAAWEAVGARARFGVDVSQHGGAELVGREVERRLLRDAADRSRSGRSLQIVTLVGTPGMGKSRLVWELFAELDALEELMYWRQGRALAYGAGPFGAISEAVRAHFGVLESDSEQETEAKVDAAVEALAADAEERGWLTKRARPLVGLPVHDAPSREEAFAAWQRLVEAIAEDRPLVLVLEDLHWADDATLDFVDHLADWTTDVPLLVVCTARPELLERRPGWGGGRLNAHTLSLTPLADNETALLLARLLGRPVLDADVQSRLVQQSAGNPLYAEEYARMLAEGSDGTSLPDTIQGIIAARLDLLTPDEKEVLQDASVLGKLFWRGGVAALTRVEGLDDALQRLIRKQFVRRERVSSMAGETELAFRHALVRDVAYGQIPRAARAEKHRRAAEWIEATAGGRPDLVAHHFVEALELTRAAGTSDAELEERAHLALRAAGDRARSLGALLDALGLYEQALELWPDGQDRLSLLLALAETAADADAGEGLRWGQALCEAAAAAGDDSALARGEAILVHASWAHGAGAEAHEHMARAVEAATRSGSREALAHIRTSQARLLMVAGRPEEAIAAGDEAIPLAEETGLEELAVRALIAVGSARSDLDLDGWEEQLVEALGRARKLNNPALVHRALNNRGHHVRRTRGPAASVPIYEEGIRNLQRYRLPFEVRWFESVQAFDNYQRGNWDRSLQFADSFASIQPGVAHYLDSEVLVTRALVAFGRGDDDGAFAAANEAMRRGRETGDLQQLGPPLVTLGNLSAQAGRTADARTFAGELLRLPPQAIVIALDWVGDLAWVAVDVEPKLGAGWDSDPTVWRRAQRAIIDGRLEDAIAIFDEIEARTDAAYARLRLARRLAEAGEDPDPWWSDAEAFYRKVGAVRYLRELEALRATRRSA